MEAQLDGPIILASLLILGVLIGSAVLWVRRAQSPKGPLDEAVGVAPWNIGWVNFGLFICAIVSTVFVAQQLGVALFVSPDPDQPAELTPELAIAAVLLLQLPMLAVFYASRRLFPALYAGDLSRAELPPLRAAAEAASVFIRFLPAVWLVSLVWGQLLSALQAAGLIGPVEPQELVQIFAEGGNPATIVLLVILAITLAPFVEEIIFRGCIYRFLKSRMTLFFAQLLSAAVFALLHGNLLSFVPLIMVGYLLAYVYENSGSLWVAIWFHAFFNSFNLAILLLTSFSDALPVP